MKFNFDLPYKVVLGSKSPRRKDLLTQMGLDFEIRIKEINEEIPEHINAYKASEYLARLKGSAYKDSLKENELIITADTLVILEEKILGKPENKKEAMDMLMSLSDNKHEVITGVSLLCDTFQYSFSESTEVDFFNLSRNEIEHYIEAFTPFDKAGSYGIQEWIGLIGTAGIKGCFYNVIGLPVPRLYQELKKLSI